MKTLAEQISGYTYGAVGASPVSLQDLENLKISVGWTDEDERYRHMTGEVLSDQTNPLVDHWRREIIGSIPNLSRHSRTPGGEPLNDYQTRSGLRFEQWVLDTCFRPYDQDWLNYQHEIALRHTSLKNNATDGVDSTPYVPLRDIIAFIAVMNETIKPYPSAREHTPGDVEKMHRAWTKSLQLQVALWARPYPNGEW
jgi:Protoglobin